MSLSPAPPLTDRADNARARDRLSVTIELTDEQLDLIAERVAERLQPAPSDEWLRGAQAIADYIGARVSRVYALSSAGRIPCQRDGSNLVARPSALDKWLENGGAKRP